MELVEMRRDDKVEDEDDEDGSEDEDIEERCGSPGSVLSSYKQAH